jgi:hypothetical protein
MEGYGVSNDVMYRRTYLNVFGIGSVHVVCVRAAAFYFYLFASFGLVDINLASLSFSLTAFYAVPSTPFRLVLSDHAVALHICC